MNSENNSPVATPSEASKGRFKLIGVGTAGAAMIAAMDRADFAGASFTVVNTEAATGLSPDIELIHLETRLLRGMGTGGDPERGRKLAEEHFARLKEACAGSEVVFILAGLGGGAGTGIAPVLARAARESAALVLGFVTTPFELEGNRRQKLANLGLEQFKASADAVVCLSNQRAYKLIDENSSLMGTFDLTARLLTEGARGVWRLLRHRGLLEVHFDELCALLRVQHGQTWFATVDAAGTTRAHDVIEKLSAHPLLEDEQALKNADTLLVSVMGGPDMTMAHVNQLMHRVSQDAPSAKVIVGAAVDESFRDRLGVTVFAVRHAKPSVEKGEPQSDELPDFDAELIHKKMAERPASRAVPPSPALTLDQRESFVAKSGLKGARGRRAASKLKQGTLPLDIVNRGRFDKTEATIRNGEDLDLPTFMRKGVKLN